MMTRLWTAWATLAIGLIGFASPMMTQAQTEAGPGQKEPSGVKQPALLQARAPVESPLHLSRMTFEFPGGGQRNHNLQIGDFCCTGETATVRSKKGAAVGYVYFYDFRGGMNCKDDGLPRSAAMKFAVLVSGIADAAQPKSPRLKSSIEFNAEEMRPGVARQTIAGALLFIATIQDVRFKNDTHSSYWMDSVRVTVDVQPAPSIEISEELDEIEPASSGRLPDDRERDQRPAAHHDAYCSPRGVFPQPRKPCPDTFTGTEKTGNFENVLNESSAGAEIACAIARSQREDAYRQHALAFTFCLEVHDASFQQIV
jgi:hypothetical protein